MPAVPKPKRRRTKHFFREWREYRDLTQEQAIGRLGWSQSKISRVESGLTPFNQDDLEVAAEAYQTTPDALLRVNPLKEGDVIDLMQLIDLKDRDTVMAILRGLPDKTGT